MVRMKTNCMRLLLTAATLGTVATMGAGSAEAVSIKSITSATDYSNFINGTFSNDDTSGFGTRLIDFNSSPFTTGSIVDPSTVSPGRNQEATFSGEGRVVTGSLGGQYAAPAANAEGGSSNTLDTTPYLTLGGSGEPGPVTLKFKYPIISTLGFLWGSVDDYNSVEFFRGTESRGLFNGLNVLSPANGDQSPSGTYFVNFMADDEADWFDSVVFTSTQAAFEIDDIRYTEIPTPALLPGLVGIGVAALRKRKGEKTAEA